MGRENNQQFSDIFKRRIYIWILKLIKFIDSLPKSDLLCRVAGNQLMRSGTSLGANYIEAIGCGTDPGFAQFLEHSLKSGNESKFWLALLKDSGKVSKEAVDLLLPELIEITKILGASIRTIRKDKKKKK